ncbi:adenylate cyclase type 10-like [Galleria mellonella]|uniref:Adenylate cyclase type 10-like n=1 Tax=Galleria mellonella TaxID=7137 RepID=A0A6J1X5S2_GALME|nr:adenylate cyclase type 10-like [Galleria mellonella]
MSFRKTRGRSRRNSMNVVLNTEKWRHYGKRISYINTNCVEEDTEDEEPEYNEIKDWVEEFFDRKSVCPNKSDQDVEVQLTKKQTLILSTLVPDEIIIMDKFDPSNPKRFVGVLLMADVSGYTALSERYSNIGKGGTYRLTVTLNTYLGSLIELIYSHGGDILKFAGDAFLALWKTDKRTFLCHTIHTVIACALIIQHFYGSYETDVKVNLKVKLAISAGNLIFSPIGSGLDMNYIIFGLPVIEAKLAESVCSSGEVKLTPTAWGHCYSRNYDHMIHKDGHVTIKSILYDPHEKDVTKPFVGFGPLIRQIKKPYTAIENLPDFFWDSSKSLNAIDIQKRNETISLRKSILIAEKKNIGSDIRKFMIRPILTQIDAHQPLEYLTEMRQVSILFITLKPKECSFPQLITIVNNAYKITCEIVYKSMGCVNKIILFDKDIMILVIFGLRGFKHESEAQAALKCAYSIKKSVSALDGVIEVSIGVTTGQVYCGVVGHPLRREFTVIGAVVNKAARLMCGFRNKITCDENTYIKSKMSTNGFTLQPKIELKGIMKPGKIYEYTEDIRVKELYDIPMIPPLLNRTDEMKYFQNWLDNSHLSCKDFDALLLVGESRIGKSRILEWMARYSKNSGYRVCYINLTSIHSATPYLALSQIIDQILGLKEPITGFIKEEKIVQLLKVYHEDLCYLNNIIKVRFAYPEGIYSQDENKRKEKAKKIFTKLIKSILETHVIFLNDLQNLDSSSWEFISIMLSAMKIFTVLSVTRGKFSSVHNWLYSVFINDNIRKIFLAPLTSTWIPALACQILDVDAVPSDLCNTLRTKCNGSPGLIESFIVHLFSSGALEIKKIPNNEIENWTNEDLQFPESTLLHPQALDAKDQPTLDQLIEKDCTDEISVCIVTKKEELKTNINVQNIDALIMIQIDSLTPYQQLLLKIASVIGNILSRDLLENIMYENNTITTAKAIKRLFAMRILSCANIQMTKWNRKYSSNILSNNSINYNLICQCPFDYDPEDNENLPKYAFCKVMKFRNKNSRKTCYELLPMNQKKEFHSRIVSYLENSIQKCLDCGGKLMIVQSIMNFQPNITYERDDSNIIDDEEEWEVETISITENNTIEEVIDLKVSKSESSNKSKKHETALATSDIKNNCSSVHSLNSQNRTSPYTSILKTKCDVDTDIGRRSTKRVIMPELHFKKISSEDEQRYKIFDMLRAVTEASTISEWQSLGVTDSQDEIHINNIDKNKKSFCIKIEKGVSRTNFNKCACGELNIVNCEQLIYHAQKAEMRIKAIEFMIKFAYLNLLNNNVDVALPKLEEAEELCLKKEGPDPLYLKKFDKRIFLGKIFSLKSAIHLLNGKLSAAKLEMERATRIYQLNLLNISEFFKIRHLFRSFKFKRRKHRTHKMVLKSDSVFCLNVATLLYSALEDEKLSRICAFRALDLVQEVECNVIDMCDTFSNAIQVELDRGTPESTLEIERLASLILRELSRPIQAHELCAVGKLFLSTFRARMFQGKLVAAIRSGFRSITISRFLQADSVSLDIIPDLFYILLARCRIEEAVDVLQITLRIGQNRMSLDFETWYYALCMDMILDAGFQLEPPHEISRFAEYALNKVSDGPSRRRLIVDLWTYWLRADVDRKAKRFESEALSWTARENDDSSLTTLLSAMRLAEGMLESLARKVNDLKKVVDLMELRSIADRELTRLEKDARLMRTIYPRWILLKANSLYLSGHHTAANTAFSQALEEASKTHNRLEQALARAATSNSRFWVQNAHANCFMSWQSGVEQAKASWHQLLYKINTTRHSS